MACGLSVLSGPLARSGLASAQRIVMGQWTVFRTGPHRCVSVAWASRVVGLSRAGTKPQMVCLFEKTTR